MEVKAKKMKRGSNKPLQYDTPANSGHLNIPWGIKEVEVEKMLLECPREKFWIGDNPLDIKPEFNVSRLYIDIFVRSGMSEKAGFTYYLTNVDVAQGNRLARNKFAYLMRLLKQHPSLLSINAKQIIASSEFLRYVMGDKYIKYMPIKGSKSKASIAVLSSNNISPLARQEIVKQDIMENLLDRMQQVVHEMTVNKIKSSNLGTLSKAMENMVKTYNMFKGESAPSALIQVNIKNMTLQEKRELSSKLGDNRTG